MSTYQVAWHAVDRIATIQPNGDALPAGSVKAGTFKHNEADDNLGDSVNDAVHDNHVFYHHVRDILYKLGVQDMQRLSIIVDNIYVAVVSFTVVPPTVSRTVGQTQQITHVWTPSDASNKNVTYTSSDPTKATVSASGLITAVAVGSATITAVAEDGLTSHTCVVTITA